MHVHFGQELYGKVDDVPGKCHVATRFFHIYYVPLIPTSSWAIRKKSASSEGQALQQIRLSLKSICIGWLMALLIGFGVFAVLHSGMELYAAFPGNDPLHSWFELFTGLMSIAVWILFLVRPLRASPARAFELLTQLGLSTEGIDPEQWDFDQSEDRAEPSEWAHSSKN